MAVDKSYARLGFFLVVAAAVVVATGLFFLHRMQTREVLDFVTYTTGNVTGLDIGSPVRFRGVPIGRVVDLRIEPRGSLVEVDFEVFIDHLTEKGSNIDTVRKQAATGSFSSFSAQIIGNPVTGEAYLLLDIPTTPRPPTNLAFTPTRVFVPFMPTAFDTLRDRLPALMDQAIATLQTLGTIVERMPASLDRTDKFFADVEQIFRTSDFPGMTRDSRRFFNMTSTQMEKMTSDIERITADLDHSLGPDGTMAKFVEEMHTSIAAANLEGTTKTTREAMNETTLAAEDLRRALPAIRDALAQLRDLARLLESQPEAVVYGARNGKGKH